jgi:hypothetical protein
MKEERKHSIDKLFLGSLGGQKIEPAAGIWESLATQIPVQSGRTTLLYLVSAILIGAFTFFMHTTLQTGSDLPGMSSETATFEAGTLKPEEEAVTAEEEALSPEDISITNESIKAAIPEQAAETNIAKEDIQDQLLNSNNSITQQAQPSIIISSSEGETPEQTRSYQAALIMLPEMEPTKVQVEENSTMGIREEHYGEPLDPIFNLKDSYARPADLLFGANFSPAVNIYPEGQNRNDYSLEVVAAYEKSRFLVETGIGGNYTTESAKYQVNYTSYDSVGYYVGVNSFAIDPTNPDSVIFETSLKNLYDSIDYYSIRENTNKYAYLQVPLRVGYRIFQAPKFSVDLKVGLLFSLQVYKDVPGVPYQGTDAENIEVERQYADRQTTSWQYTASIGFNYHINDKVRFGLVPYYRQYIKSAYSPTSEYPAKSPYAFGIRGGIYFHF